MEKEKILSLEEANKKFMSYTQVIDSDGKVYRTLDGIK